MIELTDSLTVTEVARLLGITPQAVEVKIKQGSLSVVQGGRPKRISKSDVLAAALQKQGQSVGFIKDLARVSRELGIDLGDDEPGTQSDEPAAASMAEPNNSFINYLQNELVILKAEVKELRKEAQSNWQQYQQELAGRGIAEARIEELRGQVRGLNRALDALQPNVDIELDRPADH